MATIDKSAAGSGQSSSATLKVRPVFKNILESPYAPSSWPQVSPDDAKAAFDILSTVFQTSLHHQVTPEPQADADSVRPVVLGFNNTTRALEQQAHRPEQSPDPIELVLVCKDDIVSELATAHFPALCAVARVARLVGLPRGSALKLTEAYNGLEPDGSQPPATLKRKADGGAAPTAKSPKHKSHRQLEVTVVGIRKTAQKKYPLLKGLCDMLANREAGAVIVPEIVAQLDRNKVAYKPTQIATLQTTAPIMGKKQQQAQKQAEKQSKLAKKAEKKQQQQPAKKKQKIIN